MYEQTMKNLKTKAATYQNRIYLNQREYLTAYDNHDLERQQDIEQKYNYWCRQLKTINRRITLLEPEM